jgi:hypothetical protein
MEKQSNITNFGWVEMRIPYAALRFSAEKNKLGVLIFSGNKTIPTKYTWNFIDSKLGTFTQQTEL